MLENIRDTHRKFPLLSRVLALLLPVICVVLLLSQVAFAKNTYLISDGDYVLIYSTFATDPEEVLNEAGLELGEDDTYTTQTGLGVSEITIQRKQVIHINCGASVYSVVSYGETVGQLLQRIGLTLDEGDAVSVSVNMATYDGMNISIAQTVSSEEVYTVTIPYSTEYCYDPSLAEGEQVVLTQGCDGQIQYTDTVVYVDGEETSRTNQSQRVLCEPVNELIAIGTEVELPDYPPQYTEPEQTTPAEPEEEPEQVVSGNVTACDEPIIGDGYIITTDGEVLTYTSTMHVVATAYHNTDEGCTAYTATGTLARVGAIAVDPSVIPYGTRMFIVTNDGAYVYGIAVAEDCGGAIDGNRVDLYFDTKDECWAFGVREATIYFLG